MTNIRKIVEFFLLFLCLPAFANAISGGITQYGEGPGPGGACGFTKGIWPKQGGKGPGETMLAAINIPMWEDGMNCGLCISVKATKVNRPPVTVMVIDQCPPCTGDSLDLSMKAWREVTGIYDGPVGKEPVTWDFVPCPASFTSGDMYYLLKEGSNAYALRVNPQNFPSKIKTIQIRWSGQDWKDMIKDPNTTGLYWKLEQVAPIPSGYELRSVFVDGSISGSSGPIDKFDNAIVGQSSVQGNQGNSEKSTGAFTGPVPALRGSESTSNGDPTGTLSKPTLPNTQPETNAAMQTPGDNANSGANSEVQTPRDNTNSGVNSAVQTPGGNSDSTQWKQFNTAVVTPEGNSQSTGPLFSGSDKLKSSPDASTEVSAGPDTSSGQNTESSTQSTGKNAIPQKALALTQHLISEEALSSDAALPLGSDPNTQHNTGLDPGMNMPSSPDLNGVFGPNSISSSLRTAGKRCRPIFTRPRFN